MKRISNSLLIVLTIPLLLAVTQYFFCPQMTFYAGKPFIGNAFYNPYNGLDSSKWIKGNFHAHTNSWNGLTNGSGKPADVEKAYAALGYSINCVSEYQKISPPTSGNLENYISAYEHGCNILKSHQLVIGAHDVEWLDYVFPQTSSNKQWILNKLSQPGDQIVVLNHPALRGGYTEKEMHYLVGYQCMEVLNPSVQSFAQWDAALSYGHPIFIMGNDDIHNIFEQESIGRICTWLNIDSTNPAKILEALKLGRNYGMSLGQLEGEDITHRMIRLKSQLPCLKHLRVNQDTIQLSLSTSANAIEFIGQGGKSLKVVNNSSNASYVIRNEDTYVRAAIHFDNATDIYLNPIFRFTGNPLASKPGHTINMYATYFFFLLGMIIICGWFIFLIRRIFGRIIYPKIIILKIPRLNKPYWNL